MEPGVHLVHKPAGPTSAEVFRHVLARASPGTGRRLRACHGGTLDPFARGLLLVLAGGATRLFELLHAAPKRYEAEVRWGTETDTGDPSGRPVARGDPSALSPTRLDLALAPHLGWTFQVPPATSARKVGGEPAYRKAHRGEEVSLPASRVYLHEARWLSHHLPERSVLSLTCRGGFYVRSLARDLGRSLGCGAHLGALRRTEIGPWRDPGEEGSAEGLPSRGAEALPWASARTLTDREVGELRRGRPVPLGTLSPPGWRPPRGFPLEPAPPVLGLHRGRAIFLLDRDAGGLLPRALLPGGI